MRIGAPGGSVALVTGAASGLGRAAATRLHAAGAKLVLVNTNQEAGKELADAGVGTFIPADVTSETEAEEAVAQATALGPLRVLVNCAGVGWGARIVDKNGGPHDLALFRRILDINLVGTFNMLRLAAVAMAASDPAEGEEQEPGATRAAAVERGVIILTPWPEVAAALELRPGGEQRQEDIVPVTWHVPPASWPLVVHGDGEAVHPECMQSQITQELVAGGVARAFQAGNDLAGGGCFRLEVTAHCRAELADRGEDREVQPRPGVAGKHQPTMPVDDKVLHCHRRPSSAAVQERPERIQGGRVVDGRGHRLVPAFRDAAQYTSPGWVS